MKPVLFACAAVVLYSVQNVVLGVKLAKYNTAAILIVCYLVMLPLALIGYAQTRGAAPFPRGAMLLLATLVGLSYFFADYFYVSAFTHGGDLVTITTILALLPVLSSIVKFVWVGGLPNVYQVAGYLFAAAAVYLVAKGSS